MINCPLCGESVSEIERHVDEAHSSMSRFQEFGVGERGRGGRVMRGRVPEVQGLGPPRLEVLGALMGLQPPILHILDL